MIDHRFPSSLDSFIIYALIYAYILIQTCKLPLRCGEITHFHLKFNSPISLENMMKGCIPFITWMHPFNIHYCSSLFSSCFYKSFCLLTLSQYHIYYFLVLNGISDAATLSTFITTRDERS